ncbi:MAG: hypothetical protein WHT08_17930 [Bryobacteraceae bacterium]|jgi:hypothetical protein
MRYRRRQNQRGFALLLVFALAAAALVMLYLEMPRVAFEHQREKEALLVDRGEEYVRAIQLYVAKFQKYPQKIEDLESTNNIRFLRKRFRDPITGSDEWRLIHVDAAGQYIDSLVHKRQDTKKESTPGVLQSVVQGIGVSAQVVAPEGESAAVNPALRRTASDRIIPGLAPGQQPAREPGTGEPGADPGQPSPQPQDLPPESPAPPQPGLETPVQGEPGSPAAGAPQQPPFRMPGNLPAPRPDAAPGAPAAPAPAIGSGITGIGVASPPPPPPQGQERLAPGMVPPQSLQTGMSGPAPGMDQAAQRPGAPNEALQAIQRILTRQPAQGAPQSAGVVIGGGIAGVASKADMIGIRTYNERSNIQEWEFLFDFRKALQAAGINPGQGVPGQGARQQGSPFERPGPGGSSTGGFGFGSSGSQSGSGFGGFGGFGSGSNQPRPAPAPRP